MVLTTTHTPQPCVLPWAAISWASLGLRVVRGQGEREGRRREASSRLKIYGVVAELGEMATLGMVLLLGLGDGAGWDGQAETMAKENVYSAPTPEPFGSPLSSFFPSFFLTRSRPPDATRRLTSPLAPAAAHHNHTSPTNHPTPTSCPTHAPI